ncbi:unnamed protein product [marine sediment metagenome]|uniref:Uncharacterized protein n=1 Tax=marine sediment metagenome TaxID=412755 RepID=X0U5Q9_9ZZZZ
MSKAPRIIDDLDLRGVVRNAAWESVAQLVVNNTICDKFSNVRNALIAGSFEFIERQLAFRVGLVKFLRSFACIPLRDKFRQETLDFIAVHTIATRVGASTVRIRNLAIGYDCAYDFCEIADLVVLLSDPDIECFAKYL